MSASISLLQRVIAEIATTDIPVLILGESGSGKEVIASEIHRLSTRNTKPFVKFSCSTSSFDWLLGAGVENGGNGSHARLEGTVLFDEVGQLDLDKQGLLLNLLPDGERAVSPGCLMARIISTSTRDLTEEMGAGSFREELYFRLNGICLRVPSLRQRKEDIPELFAVFLTKYANLLGRQQPPIKSSTLDLLIQHSWPGNVRELENIARKVVALGDDSLAVSDLAVSTVSRVAGKSIFNGSGGTVLSSKRPAKPRAKRSGS